MRIGVINPDKRITHYMRLVGFDVVEVEQHRPSSLTLFSMFTSDDFLKRYKTVYDISTIGDYLFSAFCQYIPSMVRRADKKGYLLYMSCGYLKVSIFEKIVMEKLSFLYKIRKITKTSKMPNMLQRMFTELDNFVSLYEPYRSIEGDILLSIYSIERKRK